VRARAVVACERAPIAEEVRLALVGLHCDVEEAHSAAEVLRRMADGPPRLVVLERALPGAERPELPRLLFRANPSTVVLFIVDPEGLSPSEIPGSSTTFRYLIRPWSQEELRSTLRSALSRAKLLAENRRLASLQEEQRKVLWEERERMARPSAPPEEPAEKRVRAVDPAAAVGLAVQEIYDARLALHARAVADGAVDLAEALALPEETVDRIQTAALLHDVGYVGLPRFLLLASDDRLTDREREDRRRHPLLGEGIARKDERLADVAPVIRHHHERFDGRGHPDGLRGEGIPLGARILRLVDVYDRAYRGAASRGAALARTSGRRAVVDARGKVLDPRLAEIFLDGVAMRSDAREVQVAIDELKEGMILTRDLRAGNGLFLASGGTRLDLQHVERIRTFHRKNPIHAEVFVRAG
jgi:response regulator RpfG family c-di-GMP phosphodiesterase